MKRIYLSSVIVIVASLFFSCKKDETTQKPAEKTPKENLTAFTWKKSQYKENGTVTPFFASCEMDDVITFKTDGNWVISDGTTICASPGITTDFYSIDADNKTLRWGGWGVGELSFNSDKTSFTFKRTGATTFEYIFVKN